MNVSSKGWNHLLKPALPILIVCLCSSISVAASSGLEHKPTPTFERSDTEELQRLRACITAVDQRLIYEGMSVCELDKVLGSEFIKEIPSKESEETVSVYKFGKRHFAWRMIVQFNGKGEVFAYAFANQDHKGYSSPEPPKARTTYIAAQFREAKDPSQKLACAIDAIESRVIGKGTQSSTLCTIFGNSPEERDVVHEPGWTGPKSFITSFEFGTDRDSWRLVTYGSIDNIYFYYLTNCCDFEPWPVRQDRLLRQARD